jgi:hypothetical protein
MAALALTGFVAGWFAHFETGHSSAVPSAATPKPLTAVSPSPAATEASRPIAPSSTALAAAIEAVRQPAGRAAKLNAFAARLRELDPSQYPALLDALRAAHFPDTSEMLAMLCSVWAGHDGPEAFAAARRLVDPDGEFGALHAAITAWAAQDPAAALRALQSAKLDGLATDEMSALMQGWAARDPAGAEKFLRQAERRAGDEEVPAAVQRGLEAIAGARVESDSAAALAWYQALPGPERAAIQQSFLARLAVADPRRAQQWLASDAEVRFGESDLLPVLRGLRLEGWEPRFEWATAAANPLTRDAALRAVVREGAAADIVALGTWLAARTDNPGLNPAFSAYAIQVVRKSPDAAITWALSLEPADLRQRTVTAVASEWATYDVHAARAWAERTRLVNWDVIAR